METKRFLQVVTGCLVVLGIWNVVSAITIDFNDPTSKDNFDFMGTTASSWQRSTVDTPTTGNIVLNYNKAYNTGTGYFAYKNASYSDVEFSSDFRFINSFSDYNRFYVRASYDTTNAFTSGYYWRFTDNAIYRMDAGVGTKIAQGTSTAGQLANLYGGVNAWHTLKFTAEGNVLTMYQWNSTSSAWEVLVTATDSTYTSGYLGAQASSTGSNTTYYDNVTINVPEPATMLLVGLGGTTLFLRRKK